MSLDEAIAELVRRGLHPDIHVRTPEPFPSFLLPNGAVPITLEQTLAADDEL